MRMPFKVLSTGGLCLALAGLGCYVLTDPESMKKFGALVQAGVGRYSEVAVGFHQPAVGRRGYDCGAGISGSGLYRSTLFGRRVRERWLRRGQSFCRTGCRPRLDRGGVQGHRDASPAGYRRVPRGTPLDPH